MTVDQVRAIILAYWRYQRQCPMVALEANCQLSAYNDGGQADILAVTKARLLAETEIKISIADLRKDQHKIKHQFYKAQHFDQPHDFRQDLYPAHYFYFAVPPDIANKAASIIVQLYPYAGLLIAKDLPFQSGPVVDMSRNAKLLHRRKLSAAELVRMAREMSATCCRLANKIANNGG